MISSGRLEHNPKLLRNAQIPQAQGMVSVQAECSIACALVRMQVRADRLGWELEDVARAIVNREMRLEAAR